MPHWTDLLTYVVIGVWLAPAVWRSRTALALITAWVAAECVTKAIDWGWIVISITDKHTPIWFYWVADAACICVIAADRAITARFIIAIYVFAAWPIYVSGEPPRTTWLALWALNLVQFLLAGRWENIRGLIDDLGAVFARYVSLGRSLHHSHASAIHGPQGDQGRAIDLESGAVAALDRKCR